MRLIFERQRNISAGPEAPTVYLDLHDLLFCELLKRTDHSGIPVQIQI
jgi:hypothetical protein